VIGALERETYLALLTELARSFVTEAASQLSSISAAVLARDLAALKRKALVLKGGAGTFGAAQLVDYASARAQACLPNDLERSVEVVRALPKEAIVACKALADRYLDDG
jgi:HPt (histidine-containing phosphotransfer) domain-containing protein